MSAFVLGSFCLRSGFALGSLWVRSYRRTQNDFTKAPQRGHIWIIQGWRMDFERCVGNIKNTKKTKKHIGIY